MNYYPFYSGLPSALGNTASSSGLFGSLFKNLSLGKILSGGQKTLNFVNQVLPLVKQAGPVINNAKTMFRVLNEFKKIDSNDFSNVVKNEDIIVKDTVKTNKVVNDKVITASKDTSVYSNGITFFQ